MGATTTRRARIVAGGLIACGAGMILSASSALAVGQEWDAVVTTAPYSPGDPTTTTPDTTPEDTTPEETTATTVDDYAPGDPVTSETTEPGVEQVADTVAAAPVTAAAAGELPRTGGSSLPLGLLGVGSVAGGSALLAALRPRRRS